MTPQELKSSILQLAVQGKLVEQRPEEGTAEELYRQIQAEKQKLIKEGKIKKGKPLPKITDDEVPFDIPESWKWVKLGDCSTYTQTKIKISPDRITPDLWSLDLEDIEKDTGRIKNFCKASERKIVGEKVCFFKGQILYSKLRPYLKKILIAPDDGICTPELVPFNMYGDFYPQYVAYVLKSPHIDYAINAVTYGVKMPRVGTDTMANLLIPLPPFSEQKRIVAKIEELLPLIDRYEQAWSKLEAFNKRFPDDMQKSVLQMAIQGRLVEQRPEEGMGEELYRQIQAEKQSLIKSGKIKKEKPCEMITEVERDLSIPDTWIFCKLVSISSKITDGEHKTPRRVLDYCGYYLLSARNVKDRQIVLDDVDYVDKDEFMRISPRCNPRKNDVLISCSGSVGRCAVVSDNNNYAMVRSAAMISPIDIDSYYLMYAIQSDYVQSQIRNRTKQAVQANLFQNAIRNLVIPLPPLAEQKRIVQKLNEILPLCKKLK